MLQALRNRLTGWVAGLIIALLIVPFAFFGIDHYFTGGVKDYVAKVGEREIAPRDYQEQLQQTRERYRQFFGDNFNAEQFNDPTFKRQILDGMIERELMLLEAERERVAISDARLAQRIHEIPAFQLDGKFSYEVYRNRLEGAQLSERQYEALLRQDLLAEELSRAIAQSSFVTEAEVRAYVRLRDQTRDFRYLALEIGDVLPPEAPTEEAVRAHYQSHLGDYRTPEEVDLEYLEIEAAKLEVEPPSEDVLRARYAEREAQYVEPEQRLASHLLVAVAADADAEAHKAAREKAEALLARARKGEDFAALAREASDDLGSKAAGGDLGWLQRGQTEAAFEEALFKLAVGAISEPVLTPQGYHLIQLRELKPEQRRSFEEVRAELEREYLDNQRERQYLDLSGRLVDAIQKDPQALAPAAESLGLPLKRSGWFSRSAPVGIAIHPEVMRRAFSDLVYKRGQVSNLITLGPNHVVAIRAADTRASAQRPFEEVRDQITNELLQRGRERALRERAEALYARLEGGASLDEVAAELKREVQRAEGVVRTAANVDPPILTEAFKLEPPRTGIRRLGKLELSAARYVLLELDRVTDGDPSRLDAQALEAAKQQLQSGWETVERTSFTASIRHRTPIDVVEDLL